MNEKYEKIFRFLEEASALKFEYRFGKARKPNDETEPKLNDETSAAHSWRASLMARVLQIELGLEINTQRATDMVIIHDLCEARAGDVDYWLVAQGIVSKDDKEVREEQAMDYLVGQLPENSQNYFRELWEEYNENETPEARFANALDKLETLTWLKEKGHKFYDAPEMLAEYGNDVITKLKELAPFARELKRRLKREFKKGGLDWKEEYEV